MISGDLHFRVNYNPGFIQMISSEPEVDEDEESNWEREKGLKENFGFSEIEILDGNIGYLKFNLNSGHRSISFPYFNYPEPIRRLIYTTNIVGGYYRIVRKIYSFL